MLILYNSQHMYRRIRRRILLKNNLLDWNISITRCEVKYNIVIQETKNVIYISMHFGPVCLLSTSSKKNIRISIYAWVSYGFIFCVAICQFFFRHKKNEKPSNITGMHALIDNWIWNSDRQSFMQLKCAVSKRSTAHSLKTICR